VVVNGLACLANLRARNRSSRSGSLLRSGTTGVECPLEGEQGFNCNLTFASLDLIPTIPCHRHLWQQTRPAERAGLGLVLPSSYLRAAKRLPWNGGGSNPG